MRTIYFEKIVNHVEKLVINTSYNLPQDVLDALIKASEFETSEIALSIFEQIIENAYIASREELPICQDTGVAVFFVGIGTEAYIEKPGIDAAVNEGMRRGYRNGALRMSMVNDPFRRHNTCDNSPAIIHYYFIDGENIEIHFCPKGGGCENMSRIAMLSPGQGREGATDFIVDTVRTARGKPCPPIILGVGIGGNFEHSAVLSKRALLRKIGERNPDDYLAALEIELLGKINSLGIGPMGLGGVTTALDVFIETAPCHIASMPVAVNIQCHAARHGSVTI
jgi:fumarate hydratase subunit alpha